MSILCTMSVLKAHVSESNTFCIYGSTVLIQTYYIFIHEHSILCWWAYWSRLIRKWNFVLIASFPLQIEGLAYCELTRDVVCQKQLPRKFCCWHRNAWIKLVAGFHYNLRILNRAGMYAFGSVWKYNKLKVWGNILSCFDSSQKQRTT